MQSLNFSRRTHRRVREAIGDPGDVLEARRVARGDGGPRLVEHVAGGNERLHPVQRTPPAATPVLRDGIHKLVLSLLVSKIVLDVGQPFPDIRDLGFPGVAPHGSTLEAQHAPRAHAKCKPGSADVSPLQLHRCRVFRERERVRLICTKKRIRTIPQSNLCVFHVHVIHRVQI